MSTSQTRPWILFHAPWTSRAKSGLVVLEQIEKFLAAVAVDPRASGAALVIREHHEAMARATRGVPATPENLARALRAFAYHPAPRIEDAERELGSGVHGLWASGSTGFQFQWRWDRQSHPVDPAPFLACYRAHEALPRVDGMMVVDVVLSFWFEIKRPGTVEPLFPGAGLRSSAMVHVGSRSVNLSLRYDAPAFTPELRAIHAEILAALGPKTPRHALQQIIPAAHPGRERRVNIC